MMNPKYIFETSWEVCNRVGGIYAVLSTRAASMQKMCPDKVFFFGPDLWKDSESPYFEEDVNLLSVWVKQAKSKDIKVRVGRWKVPGKPIAILIDYSPLWPQKNAIYGAMWDDFQVQSHAAYGDYDDSSMFAYATGMAMESLYHFLRLEKMPVVAHFNEWQTCFGLLYLKKHLPQIGTLFTTHATGIGRSIAGNGKPLYDYFEGYHGDQMASELGMVSKHSAEKQAAHAADCFTTVSEITARECRQLLDKPVDIVTPNGFEPDFVPGGKDFTRKRQAARKRLSEVAEKVLGYNLKPNIFFVCTSGRYEWKNKGLDAFVYGLAKLRDIMVTDREIVAFVMVPGWQQGAHARLGQEDNLTTHRLVQPWADPMVQTLGQLHFFNQKQDKIKVIFCPSYLHGNDGIFNMSYYDLLIGMDLTVFPSYYEPWGYTPLESTAFSVPTITTSLSGFGQWCEQAGTDTVERGVEVVERTDSNWNHLLVQLASAIQRAAMLSPTDITTARKAAHDLAAKAEWKHFFAYYKKAYQIALKHAGWE